jgi:acetylornithine deacetylase/succinyl-diaminopimelate desuccinylase-like protein
MSPQTNYIEQLKAFINFPTVSSDASKKEPIRRCAQWLVDQLLSIGMQKAGTFTTSSYPVVYAEYITPASCQTILFYGHYDVQPTDPEDKWSSPPFKAVVKDHYLIGRGASDDKGQLFIHIKAVEQLIKSKTSLPVNIKFLIEGAEEVGSSGLKEFISRHKDLLRCDVVVVSDTKMAALNVPAITYSLRGALNAEVFIQTSKKDLHSGTFGGCIPNAAIFLSTLIHGLHHPDHTIAITDFYKDVRVENKEEIAFMKRNGLRDSEILADAESRWGWGEAGFSLYERSTIRPSLSITGIKGGFQGSGVKNVIPSAASVKLNFRLVPDQRPEKVQALFEHYLKAVLPAFVKVQTVFSSPANPVTVSRRNLYITAAANALNKVFHQHPKMIRAGGTIPAVDFLTTSLKVPVVLLGFAQASDNMHAPNEKFYLPNFFRGVEAVKYFILNVSGLPGKGNCLYDSVITKMKQYAGD